MMTPSLHLIGPPYVYVEEFKWVCGMGLAFGKMRFGEFCHRAGGSYGLCVWFLAWFDLKVHGRQFLFKSMP